MNTYRRGDIWWTDLGEDEWMHEKHLQTGYRPCLIVSNDINNRCSPLVTVVPLTTHSKDLPVHTHIYIGGKLNKVLCEQIRAVPKVLLKKFMGYAEKSVVDRVEDCIKIQLGLHK